LFQGLARILAQNEIMPGIYLLEIESSDIAAAAKPGQFVMISCDSGSGRLLRRPISINLVKNDVVTFLYAAIGEGTKWLAQRKPGESLDLLGPLGNGFSIDPESHNILLVAGGMGIAPLCWTAQIALKQGKSVKLLIGAKNSSLVFPQALLPESIETLIMTEDGSTGKKGMITALLPEQTRSVDQIFICGPLPMYKAINRDFLPLLKGKTVQVSLEVRMACGLGFCYACTIKTRQGLKQVCKDGPVFNLEDIIWDELR
jgi:dihydroorotate dehydrogenase electron transfer subunit